MGVIPKEFKSEEVENYSMDYRTEYNRLFQLERTYNDHLVQLPGQFRADLKLKHVVKGVAQMPLTH